ncbi:MAG: SprT family zinc-dependent metalloprotease [Pseudomonadota bacterium]
MEHIDLDGAPPVRVHVRQSARARRMSLRVSRLDGRVTLTVPRGIRLHPARAFATEKAAWIRAQLAGLPGREGVELGTLLPVEGREVGVVSDARTAYRPDSGQITVSRRVRAVGPAVAGVLKAVARERLAQASDRYAASLGRRYTRLVLRDTRSRWGSCSSEGVLMYSWRLILAPPEVLEYVAAHEVAHLAEMNHGPRFWAEVARLYPGHAAERRWLRDQGETLHRWRFEGA